LKPDRKQLLLATLVATAVAAVLAPAQPAVAMPPIDIEIGYADQVIQAHNFDLVSTQDNFSGFALSAAVRPITRWSHLWLELDESYGTTQGGLHEVGAAALQSNDLGLSVLYRRRLVGSLGWFARAGGHLAIANLALQDNSGNTQASQWQAEPGVGGGVGLELAARPPEWHGTDLHDRSFGVRAELGYIWFPDLQFDDLAPPTPSPKPTTTPIPSAPLAMGSVTLSGLHIGLTAFVRF
jgi:hypothetical protein